jgi:hypothetical protein
MQAHRWIRRLSADDASAQSNTTTTSGEPADCVESGDLPCHTFIAHFACTARTPARTAQGDSPCNPYRHFSHPSLSALPLARRI